MTGMVASAEDEDLTYVARSDRVEVQEEPEVGGAVLGPADGEPLLQRDADVVEPLALARGHEQSEGVRQRVLVIAPEAPPVDLEGGGKATPQPLEQRQGVLAAEGGAGEAGLRQGR